MLMIPIKHLKKDVKKVISNSYREEMKELVTKLHKQLIIRNIKNSKIQNECNELNKNNSNINKEIEVLQLQYNKLRSQLETLINLIVELHKSEKKSLTGSNSYCYHKYYYYQYHSYHYCYQYYFFQHYYQLYY